MKVIVLKTLELVFWTMRTNGFMIMIQVIPVPVLRTQTGCRMPFTYIPILLTRQVKWLRTASRSDGYKKVLHAEKMIFSIQSVFPGNALLY